MIVTNFDEKWMVVLVLQIRICNSGFATQDLPGIKKVTYYTSLSVSLVWSAAFGNVCHGRFVIMKLK